MLALLLYAFSALLCLIIGLLYIFSPIFVRSIARQPSAVSTPAGKVIAKFIGCVFLFAAIMLGFLCWRHITALGLFMRRCHIFVQRNRSTFRLAIPITAAIRTSNKLASSCPGLLPTAWPLILSV